MTEVRGMSASRHHPVIDNITAPHVNMRSTTHVKRNFEKSTHTFQNHEFARTMGTRTDTPSIHRGMSKRHSKAVNAFQLSLHPGWRQAQLCKLFTSDTQILHREDVTWFGCSRRLQHKNMLAACHKVCTKEFRKVIVSLLFLR